LQEKVLPWLFEKVEMFIENSDRINENVHAIVEYGIRVQQKKYYKKVVEK
jgi:hypothetical protein